MRISYKQYNLPVNKRNLFIADLIGYKLQRDMEATKKIRAISDDKRYLAKIVNAASKGSATGASIEMVVQGLQTALDLDIFSFKVNGIDLFKLASEKIGGDTFELEISMNDLYFSAEVALTQAIVGGFRKRTIDEAYITSKLDKAKKAWMFRFEKDTKEYLDPTIYKKQILEP